MTHDQVEAMTLGDRVVVMRDGADAASRRPARTLQSPVNRFVAGFIGSPAMNFASASRVADEGGALHAVGDGIR